LVLEHLETIPQAGTTFRLGEHTLEVMQIADNAIRTVRIRPLKH
jgi:Mg2+/Co2+ transporter CorB